MHTWVKLHLALRDSDIYGDMTAKCVFMHLLLIANDNGKGWFTRTSISDELGVNSNTIYSALVRCAKKYDLVNISSNSRKTTFSIKNWSKYQTIGNNDINSPSTAHQQPINNDTSINERADIDRDIDINTTNVVLADSQPERKNVFVQQVVDKFCLESGLSKPSDKYPRRSSQNLVQTSRKILRRYNEGDEKLGLFIDRFFEWYFSQDFAEKTTSIRGVYNSLARYDRDVVIPNKGKGNV